MNRHVRHHMVLNGKHGLSLLRTVFPYQQMKTISKSMKSLKFVILFLFSGLNLYAQNDCDCKSTLKFLSRKIEVNSASFRHQVVEHQREKEYKKHKKKLKKISKELKSQKECIGLIQLYLSFLRDSHQKIYFEDQYYASQPKVENYSLIIQEEENEILGDWFFSTGEYKIQIQKNNNNGRSFIGVMASPFKNFAKKGDLKIEFYKNDNEELICNYWSFRQKPFTFKVTLTEDKLILGRDITFYRKPPLKAQNNNNEIPNSTFFKKISTQTNYLRIHTFKYENKRTIDSLLIANHEQLESSENLIIDIRNNGGGSDYSFKSILPYILDSIYYTSPYTGSIWVSKNNFNLYHDERYTYEVLSKKDSIKADERIKELKKHQNKFEPYQFEKIKLDTIYTNPKKVYILTNKWNASTSEGFILLSKQSNKVKTFGERTAGMISYGEWRKIEIPDMPIWISITRKKMVFYENSDFELIGLEPDVKLHPDNKLDWMDKVLKEIEQ